MQEIRTEELVIVLFIFYLAFQISYLLITKFIPLITRKADDQIKQLFDSQTELNKKMEKILDRHDKIQELVVEIRHKQVKHDSKIQQMEYEIDKILEKDRST